MMRWLLVFVACSSSAPPKQDLGNGSLYAIAATLNANTAAATSLVYTVSSLASGTADDSRAIPIADTVSLFGVESSGSVWATTAMTPEITRYDLAADGTLKPAGVLSFANFGVGATYSTRSLIFIAPDKAYFLDDTTLQAITFDPSGMTTGKAIDLGALKQTGYLTNFSYNIPVRGTQIVIPALYYNSSYSRTIAQTSLALLETSDDSVTTISDSRCGVFSTVAEKNGDLYFGTDTYAVAIHRIAPAAAPDGCLLRMKAGANVFDPDFLVAISSLTGGQPGGAAVPADGDSLWVRAFDERLAMVTPVTSALTLLAAPAWRWWKVDPKSSTAAQSPFAPGAGEVKYFTVEGHAWAGNPNQDYTTSTLLDMTSPGAPIAGVVVKGQPSGIVKLR
jgi:hypothetical protein